MPDAWPTAVPNLRAARPLMTPLKPQRRWRWLAAPRPPGRLPHRHLRRAEGYDRLGGGLRSWCGGAGDGGRADGRLHDLRHRCRNAAGHDSPGSRAVQHRCRNSLAVRLEDFVLRARQRDARRQRRQFALGGGSDGDWRRLRTSIGFGRRKRGCAGRLRGHRIAAFQALWLDLHDRYRRRWCGLARRGCQDRRQRIGRGPSFSVVGPLFGLHEFGFQLAHGGAQAGELFGGLLALDLLGPRTVFAASPVTASTKPGRVPATAR